jgi:hypothetical protein
VNCAFFGSRGAEQRFPLTAEAFPSIDPVDDDSSLIQDVGQQHRGLSSVLEQDKVDRSPDAPLEAPPKLGDLLQICGGMVDQQVDIGLRQIVAGGGGAKQNRQADVVLRAQRAPETAQKPPVLAQVTLLPIGQPQFSSPKSLTSQEALIRVAAERPLVAVERLGRLCKRVAHVSRSYRSCVQVVRTICELARGGS